MHPLPSTFVILCLSQIPRFAIVSSPVSCGLTAISEALLSCFCVETATGNVPVDTYRKLEHGCRQSVFLEILDLHRSLP